MNSKYSNLLTVLLVIVIVAIIGIIAFLGYKYYESNAMKNNSEDFVDTFLNDLNSGSIITITIIITIIKIQNQMTTYLMELMKEKIIVLQHQDQHLNLMGLLQQVQ